jgi:2-keto-4-pentenoate hydratase/2-oxohepta-3-ene-1,7-dioic acid hydratase in catechol pathway
MKLVRFNGGRLGAVRGDRVTDVTDIAGLRPDEFPPVGMVRLIADFAAHKAALDAARGPELSLDTLTLETPVPWPNKLIAFPINFKAHGEEILNAPKALMARGFFLKAPSSLSGAGEAIVLPDLPGRQIHHEAEIGIVIGRQCRHVSREEALHVVFGYGCALDITVRDMAVDRVLRKSYDTFSPFGPWIVTADEVPDPSQLQMKLWVGSELRQDANLRDLLVDIPGMIAMTSAVMTLYPGDIIFGGTPAGIGPIQAGDVVTIDIEQVGRMSVRVEQGQGGGNSAFEGFDPDFNGTVTRPVSGP